jgi:hypothetical protein
MSTSSAITSAGFWCRIGRHREALDNRLVYVFRPFPIERANPGAELAARVTEA